VSGGRLYDAHIAEIARLASARIVVTENPRHFVALLRHGIRVWSGEEYAAEAGPRPDLDAAGWLSAR